MRFSALTDFARCRAAGGRFLLRIEDIDATRSRPEYEAGIHADLGLARYYVGAAGAPAVEHMDDYAKALKRLTEMGPGLPQLLCRGPTSPAAAADPTSLRDPDGAPLYPGTDRGLSEAEASARIAAGAPYALRLRMERAIALAGSLAWHEEEEGTVAANPAAWGDVVIARKETPTSYHLAVTVDDAAQGVTHVVRGRDLYRATSVHVLLQRLLGVPSPQLPSPPAHPGRERAEALQVGRRPVAAGVARGRRDTGGRAPDGGARLEPLHRVQPERHRDDGKAGGQRDGIGGERLARP
ncbi:MAG: glutamate--tRNA ligase family protein [Bauldia sp.]